MLIPVDEIVHFDVTLHHPSTGAVTDGDSAPTYDVFEEATDTPILDDQAMTKRTSLTGNYRGSFTASAANGFEAGKWYTVVATGIVNSITAKHVAMLFRVAPAESSAGVPKMDVSLFGGSAGTFASGRPEVNTSHVAGTVQTAGDLIGDTNDIQTRLPAALVGGRIDASVGAMAAGTVTAAAIATDAIDADAIADNAIDAGAFAANAITSAKVADGALTAAKFASGAFDAVWTVAARTLTAFDASFKTGYALSAAGVQAIWDALTSALTTVGSIGKWILDKLDVVVSTRASQTSVDDLPTNAELATALAALNDLSAAEIRTALGLSSANLDTQLGDLPTNAELATALATADDAVLAAIAALNNLSQVNVRTAIGLASANLDTQLGDLPTNAELATALATADDAVLTAIAALNNLSAAQVNAEVKDVLETDTHAEPASVPAATASLKDKIGWLTVLARNTIQQTAALQTLKDNAESGDIATAAVSDDGTTFERTKWA